MSQTKVPGEQQSTRGSGSNLERQLIAQYLWSKGYRRGDLQNLPEAERKALMKEACLYAAMKLARIEALAKFKHEIEAP